MRYIYQYYLGQEYERFLVVTLSLTPVYEHLSGVRRGSV